MYFLTRHLENKLFFDNYKKKIKIQIKKNCFAFFFLNIVKYNYTKLATRIGYKTMYF